METDKRDKIIYKNISIIIFFLNSSAICHILIFPQQETVEVERSSSSSQTLHAGLQLGVMYYHFCICNMKKRY